MRRVRAFLRVSALLAFHVAVVRPLLRWFWGVKYRRLGRVPKGPCLVIANHNSHLDAAVLMALFPLSRLPHVHPVAAADNFGKTWFRRGLAMVLMNGIPIDRTAGPGRDVLQPMIEALKRGETLIFFPEGSRGEAGVVAPFRPGVGRLVQKVPGLLVVPVFPTTAPLSMTLSVITIDSRTTAPARTITPGESTVLSTLAPYSMKHPSQIMLA